MARYRITCVLHDYNKVITHVGLQTGQRLTVQNAVDIVRAGKDSFFTLVAGREANVYAKKILYRENGF